MVTSGSAGDGTLEGLTITAGHADGVSPHNNGGDPATGAPRGSVDLAVFADADGLEVRPTGQTS